MKLKIFATLRHWQLFRLPVAFVFACALALCTAQSGPGPAARVNPLIGTANEGNTFPGAVLPFGMVAFSPEELPTHGAGVSQPGGYAYGAKQVRGFSLTHLSGAGCTGSGDFFFMPITHDLTESPSLDLRDPAYLSQIRHESERASAGLYSVRLDNGVLTELSATLRAGVAQFTYPAGQKAILLVRSSDNETVSTGAAVTIDPEHQTVSGWLRSGGFCGGSPPSDYDAYYTIFFVAQFDQPFASYGTWQDGEVRPGSKSAQGGTAIAGKNARDGDTPGKGSGAYLSFSNAQRPVQVRVGISYVSEQNAAANLREEASWQVSFDAIKARAYSAWNKALRRIEVQGGTPEQTAVFYTALYHAQLHMNLASDVNGQYRGMDGDVHRVVKPQAAQYANFSGWDVYRSQLQLIALLDPGIASDMAQSLLNQAEQWGCWSRWTHETGASNVMNGDPSVPAIASIAAFGGDRFDIKSAYASLLDAAYVPHEGHRCSRPHLDQWIAQHYLTASNPRHDTSVADTLEYSTADFALSQLAARMDDSPKQEDLLRRAQNWKNLFNPKAASQQGFLQARRADGSWKDFDPASKDGFVEGTGAQYLWMVPFNARGLFALLGGDAEAERRLDAFFHDNSGGWAFTSGGLHPGLDNEPCVGDPWLYDFAGAPYKTQETVRAIEDKLWRNAPDGIPGNDDLGEMSAWYVWAALGMYPALPGRAELVLTSPLFSQSVIERPGRTIRIVVHKPAVSHRFIKKLEVNARESPRVWLPESFVRQGGTLDFYLGKSPSRNWGVSASDAPPSFDAR